MPAPAGSEQQRPDVDAIDIDSVTAILVGPGCLRRDLPSRDGVRIWVVDMGPGSEWPHVDQHDEHGEDVYVVSGTLIDGDRSYPAGSFLRFGAHSRHRPRSDTGVRLFGFNLLARRTP